MRRSAEKTDEEDDLCDYDAANLLPRKIKYRRLKADVIRLMIREHNADKNFYDKYSKAEVVKERSHTFQKRVLKVFNQSKRSCSVTNVLADCMQQTNVQIKRE